MSGNNVYKEAYPVGTRVRIVERASLEQFKASWLHHHKLQQEQLGYAGRVTKVREVGFYHGGDAVYTLVGIPGQWLEQCLEPAPSRPPWYKIWRRVRLGK